MHSYFRTIGLVSAAIALASCAGYPPPGTTFIRADGQNIAPEKLATDRDGCFGLEKNVESCMSDKGYALVRDDEVAAKQQEFAENAEKKKQEQAALVAAEKKKQAALRRATAKKKQNTKIAAPVQPAQDPAWAAPNGPPPATNAQSSPWPQHNSASVPAPAPQR